MITDRDLLLRAWPLGYLPMRGVLTVGGWTFAGIQHKYETERQERWFPPPRWEHPSGFAGSDYALASMGGAVGVGDLLPAVDPTDTATWACLLADCARAAWPTEPGPFDRLALRRPVTGTWTLQASVPSLKRPGTCMGLEVCFGVSAIPTDDPALALVHVRIALRESTP